MSIIILFDKNTIEMEIMEAMNVNIVNRKEMKVSTI